MSSIKPILVEIRCAQQDQRARGGNPCASFSNGNAIGEGRTLHDASRAAQNRARAARWKQRQVSTNGTYRALVCPACSALLDKDKAATR